MSASWWGSERGVARELELELELQLKVKARSLFIVV